MVLGVTKRRRTSFDYVREHYGVPAKRGQRVRYTDVHGKVEEGIITSASNYVHIRFDSMRFSVPVHPWESGLEYLGYERVGCRFVPVDT